MSDSFPVALFSGLPGSGKTATLVKRILDLQRYEPGRPVFQFGINGLKEGMAIPLTEDMLHKWWELPPGSIICIDECQEDGTNPDQPVSLMPKDRGNPPAWVQRITKVRHYGMSFLLTTQHPANMSAYVRRLVNLHVHSVMRSKGVRQTFTWMRCIDDPDSRREKKIAEMSFSPLPKEVFELYKSSSLHTMKVRTPRIVWVGAALAAVAVVLAVAIPYRMHNLTKPMQVQQSVAAPASGSISQSDSLRVRDFGKWMKPRVDGVPWSAPMFDHLEVQAKPRLYCIAADDGRCTCNTEQGTHYVVDLKVCRAIVADGLYNPFQPPPGGDSSPSDAHEQDASGSQPASRREAALPLVGSQASSVADVNVSGGEKPRATALNYVPPTMGKWDPTPLPSGTGM